MQNDMSATFIHRFGFVGPPRGIKRRPTDLSHSPAGIRIYMLADRSAFAFLLVFGARSAAGQKYLWSINMARDMYKQLMREGTYVLRIVQTCLEKRMWLLDQNIVDIVKA